jgi:hypothetical protein
MKLYLPHRIPITKLQCERMNFDVDERYHESGNYDWIARRGMIKIVSLNDEVNVILATCGGQTSLEHIKYLHQVKRLFYSLHNEEI